MTRTTSVKQDLRQGATIFFYQLKKSRTPLILFAVLAVFFGTTVFALTAMNARSVNRFYQVDRVNAIQSFSTYATLAVFFLTCVFTIIYTLRVFSYLHSKRKADWINPLPVKSGVLFVAKALAAFAAAVVPALVFIGVICIITACSGEAVNSEILRLFLGIPLGSIACIAFYGLLAVCCGSSVNTVLSFLAISFCYPFSAAFVKGMIKAFFYAAPFEQTSHSFIMDALNPMAAYDGVNAVYWLLFTLGCFVLSVLLLRRRKAERAQTSFAYRLPCYAVEVLVTFIAGMMTGVIFSSTGVLDGSLGSFTFGFILGGGTAFIIAHVILFHGFAHILRSLIAYGAVSAAAVGFAAVCVFASPAYNSYLPAREDVKSAGYVGYNAVLFDGISQTARGAAADFDRADDIDLIWDQHKRLVGYFDKASTRAQFRHIITGSLRHVATVLTGAYPNSSELFAYTLNDGSVVTRAFDNMWIMDSIMYYDDAGESSYDIYTDYFAANYMSPITNSAGYLKKYSGILQIGIEDVESTYINIDGIPYSVKNVPSNGDQPQKLLQAVQADVKEHGFSNDVDGDGYQMIIYTNQTVPHSNITAFALMMPSEPAIALNGVQGIDIIVPKEYTQTRKVLEEIGVTKNGKANTETYYYDLYNYYGGATEYDGSYIP